MVTRDAILEGDGSIRLKNIPGTIEQGVCLVRDSSCQEKIAASVRELFGAAPYSRRVGISKYTIPWKVLPAKKQGGPLNVML